MFKLVNLKKISSIPSNIYCGLYTTLTRNMSITPASLKEKLEKNLNIEHLEIIDESNCDCGLKFNVLIVSDDFKGKPLIQRHRMVNSILEEELKTIHAFSQNTKTVEQWKNSN